MTSYNILALVIGFMLMLTVFYISMISFEQEIPQDPFILMIAGIIYGVCIMSPGISGSTVLLALGLFSMVISGLSEFDLSSILPLIVGAIIGILLFAKFIDHFITNHRKSTYFAIVGLTAGSAVTVIIQALMQVNDSNLIGSIVAIAIGIVLGLGTRIIIRRYMVPKESDNRPQC